MTLKFLIAHYSTTMVRLSPPQSLASEESAALLMFARPGLSQRSITIRPMPRYFKLVCLHNDPDFLVSEFREGRARFGWSPPGTDLRAIQQISGPSRTDQQKVTWRYTKFLVERICAGDRIVVQMEQPIEKFVIGEVIDPGYDFAPGNLDDFNHVLNVRFLTHDPISINAKDVGLALKHDLSKRGHYYEIYPEASIQELDRLVDKATSRTLDLHAIRTDEDNRDRTFKVATEGLISVISGHWPTHSFEKFCEMLCESTEYIQVKERKDHGKGWDLMVRLINPLTGTIALDDIPVQCKNYHGIVTSLGPIDDLERCIRNTGGTLALLFILGELSNEFRGNLQKRQEKLSRELGREISFEVIDQDRIAELYVCYISQRLGGRPGPADSATD
jgi:hypothetical protein